MLEPGDDFAGTRGGQGTIPKLHSSKLHSSTYIDFSTSIQGYAGQLATSMAWRTCGRTLQSDREADRWAHSSPTISPIVWELPAETTLSASVFNVTDEDPPFVRLDLSYEPFIGNPLGRYYKMTLARNGSEGQQTLGSAYAGSSVPFGT